MQQQQAQDVTQYMRRWSKRVDEVLRQHLPSAATYPEKLHQALHYVVFAPGKRFRPILMLAAAEALGATPENVLLAGAGIELIHTASITLDDLPCMDDADTRRGQETVHLVFGEDAAVLVATALLMEGIALVSLNTSQQGLPPAIAGRIVQETAGAVSTAGMVGGQFVDLHAPMGELDSKTVKFVHRRKTGALIVAGVRSAAQLCRAAPEGLEALTNFAHKLGLAFQISDDILDLTGNQAKLGKRINEDEQSPNFARLIGVGAAREELDELISGALKNLEAFASSAHRLRALAGFVRDRQA